jgi:hypothetical protein
MAEGVTEIATPYPRSNGKFKTINLKIKGDTKKDFLEITHSRHTTMQDVLAAFVDSYVENPEKFRIKMEVM